MSAVGTSRRLQALCMVGWSHTDLAQYLFMSRGVITKAIHVDSNLDLPWLAERYEGMVDGPDEISHRTMQSARRAGYAHPDEWAGVDMDDPLVGPRRNHTGRPPVLCGQELIDYIVKRINDPGKIASVTYAAGYSSPMRCAQKLARVRRADIGRALLERASFEERVTAMSQVFAVG